jgi:hypothetical protein
VQGDVPERAAVSESLVGLQTVDHETAGTMARGFAPAPVVFMGSEKTTTIVGSTGAWGPVGEKEMTVGGVESISNGPL